VAVFIAFENRMTPLRPLSFTAYIAMSALRSSVSTSLPSAG
jgi:hypothetical protein